MEAQDRTLDEVPEWGRDTVRYLLAKNYLRRQEDGTLRLSCATQEGGTVLVFDPATGEVWDGDAGGSPAG